MKHPGRKGLNAINGILMLPIVAVADAKRMLVMTASINVGCVEKSGKKHFFSHLNWITLKFILVMKKIKYNLVFFIFYSVFLTLSIFLFDRPAWRDVISAAIISLIMVLVFYLFDRHNERKEKNKQK
ncbi:MAG: hypothetical protein PHE07_01525 [Bacteroidales bacterium]|nr:hypothetical protein [Bacteroidales bacterium]